MADKTIKMVLAGIPTWEAQPTFEEWKERLRHAKTVVDGIALLHMLPKLFWEEHGGAARFLLELVDAWKEDWCEACNKGYVNCRHGAFWKKACDVLAFELFTSSSSPTEVPWWRLVDDRTFHPDPTAYALMLRVLAKSAFRSDRPKIVRQFVHHSLAVVHNHPSGISPHVAQAVDGHLVPLLKLGGSDLVRIDDPSEEMHEALRTIVFEADKDGWKPTSIEEAITKYDRQPYAIKLLVMNVCWEQQAKHKR